MQINHRREVRRSCAKPCGVTWKDTAGLTHSAQARCVDISASGMALDCTAAITPNTAVYVQGQDGYPTGYAVVRHCTPAGARFTIGLEFEEATKNASALDSDGAEDHYEFLQISSKAQPETVQRIYRFLASRYHPDNRETGDPEKFVRLNEAYEVLSNAERRAEYDATLKRRREQPDALFGSIDFLDGVEGEINRRIAVLSLLYRSCRANIHNAHVSILDLERQMGFPREYLDFAIWYLRSKKYVKQEDNAQLALTALGVDYIEENYVKQPLLRKLINGGVERSEYPASNGTTDNHDAQLFMLSAGSTSPEEDEHEPQASENDAI
jgi:curved DNA-binding protein